MILLSSTQTFKQLLNLEKKILFRPTVKKTKSQLSHEEWNSPVASRGKTGSTAENIPTLAWSSHRSVDIFQRVAYHFPHTMLIPDGFPSGCFTVETCPVRASIIGGPRWARKMQNSRPLFVDYCLSARLCGSLLSFPDIFAPGTMKIRVSGNFRLRGGWLDRAPLFFLFSFLSLSLPLSPFFNFWLSRKSSRSVAHSFTPSSMLRRCCSFERP